MNIVRLTEKGLLEIEQTIAAYNFLLLLLIQF